MPEKCHWISFQAHRTHYNESEDEHPDFFGVFACPSLRPEPEMLLREVLSNRNLFLAQITATKLMADTDDWGMNERLKSQMNEQGFALTLTKIHGIAPGD